MCQQAVPSSCIIPAIEHVLSQCQQQHLLQCRPAVGAVDEWPRKLQTSSSAHLAARIHLPLRSLSFAILCRNCRGFHGQKATRSVQQLQLESTALHASINKSSICKKRRAQTQLGPQQHTIANISKASTSQPGSELRTSLRLQKRPRRHYSSDVLPEESPRGICAEQLQTEETHGGELRRSKRERKPITFEPHDDDAQPAPAEDQAGCSPPQPDMHDRTRPAMHGPRGGSSAAKKHDLEEASESPNGSNDSAQNGLQPKHETGSAAGPSLPKVILRKANPSQLGNQHPSRGRNPAAAEGSQKTSHALPDPGLDSIDSSVGDALVMTGTVDPQSDKPTYGRLLMAETGQPGSNREMTSTVLASGAPQKGLKSTEGESSERPPDICNSGEPNTPQQGPRMLSANQQTPEASPHSFLPASALSFVSASAQQQQQQPGKATMIMHRPADTAMAMRPDAHDVAHAAPSGAPAAEAATAPPQQPNLDSLANPGEPPAALQEPGSHPSVALPTSKEQHTLPQIKSPATPARVAPRPHVRMVSPIGPSILASAVSILKSAPASQNPELKDAWPTTQQPGVMRTANGWQGGLQISSALSSPRVKPMKRAYRRRLKLEDPASAEPMISRGA